jgi:mevalonate kinase
MLTTFPAKVLLLGEYTILNGSKAFALPFNDFHGKWSYEDNSLGPRIQSRKSLRNFIEKSKAANLDLERMKKDYLNGLWFDSSIPQGFGLGSSGAVIAAIFHSYGKPNNDIHSDKNSLARLEDFFHGSSSGLDPLVSFVQKPLLIHSFDEVETLNVKPNLNGFFLINTNRPRLTGPLVTIYQEKMKDSLFKQGCVNILSKDVNLAIDALLRADSVNLFHHLWHISKFQWEYFPEMISSKERALWTRGLETGDYVLKLCGAGGGGFILGHSLKFTMDEMREILKTHELGELK